MSYRARRSATVSWSGWPWLASNDRHELVEVVLVTTGHRGLEEHLRRLAARVAESMRDSGRHEHECARAAGDHRLARFRFPPMPIADRPVDRLEGEDVKLAFNDVEDLFANGVHMRADIKPWPDDDLETRCQRRIVGGHLDRSVEAAADYPAPATRRMYNTGGHQARVAIVVIGRVVMSAAASNGARSSGCGREGRARLPVPAGGVGIRVRRRGVRSGTRLVRGRALRRAGGALYPDRQCPLDAPRGEAGVHRGRAVRSLRRRAVVRRVVPGHAVRLSWSAVVSINFGRSGMFAW